MPCFHTWLRAGFEPHGAVAGAGGGQEQDQAAACHAGGWEPLRARSPAVPFNTFLGEGSPTKITFLLEDLDGAGVKLAFPFASLGASLDRASGTFSKEGFGTSNRPLVRSRLQVK